MKEDTYPYCGSEDIEIIDSELYAQVRYEIKCDNCGKVYYQWYNLVFDTNTD